MNTINRNIKQRVILWMILSTSLFVLLQSQSQIIPLDHQLHNRLFKNIYDVLNSKHTSMYPLELRDVTSSGNYDSLISIGRVVRMTDESWLLRKLYGEHLVDVINDGFRLYGDVNIDFQVGRDLEDSRNTFVNTRGFLFGGTIDDVSFYTEFFESQAIFPRYIDSYIRKNFVVPGQGYQRSFVKNTFDYSNVSAIVTYRPSRYISFQGGQGKNFIGDGYRSLLLSDVAFAYPYFKITADVWKIKYMALWAEFQNVDKRPLGDRFPWDKKSGVFHYLDVNITDRFSVGLFEGIIWLPQDSTYHRGFEWNYLNPIIFLRPTEFSLGSPDNVVMGLNVRYILTENEVVYGQFMIDEMTIDEFLSNRGYWANKYGVQLGGKSNSPLNIPGLFVQGELNLASPYTYSHKDPLKNYGHYRQSLAHPFGSNFYEGIGIVCYGISRYELNLTMNYSRFGSDSSANINYGQDIFKSYGTRVRDYGNFIGQGIQNRLLYADVTASYILNPLTNLRIEASYVYRSLETGNTTSQTSWFSIGVRTSFRNVYYDF